MEPKIAERVFTTVSNIFSIVLHPVFLPIYGLLIIFNAPTFLVHLPASLKRIIFLLATINMAIVPIALLPFLKYRNLIQTYHIDKRQERILPLAIGTMMYIVTTVIFFSYEIPQIIKSFVLSASLCSVIILGITFYWKVSIHSAGMGALLASVTVLSTRMMADLSIIWIVLLILSGLLLSARLYLKSHNPLQIYIGFLTGFLSVFIVMTIY